MLISICVQEVERSQPIYFDRKRILHQKVQRLGCFLLGVTHIQIFIVFWINFFDQTVCMVSVKASLYNKHFCVGGFKQLCCHCRSVRQLNVGCERGLRFCYSYFILFCGSFKCFQHFIIANELELILSDGDSPNLSGIIKQNWYFITTKF